MLRSAATRPNGTAIFGVSAGEKLQRLPSSVYWSGLGAWGIRRYRGSQRQYPVDFEQREGRVHRYKGHAIRKNVTQRFGLQALKDAWDTEGDPWKRLFAMAASTRPDTANDLVPYWVYEDTGEPACIERMIPAIPFSREERQLDVLKRSLAVYRLAFGQPRQEDLVAHLVAQGASELADAVSLCIDLRPPTHTEPGRHVRTY